MSLLETDVVPVAVCVAGPVPSAEAQEVTGQCSAQETALWSHCYSCLRLSTCFKECGHQSLEEPPQGLQEEKEEKNLCISCRCKPRKLKKKKKASSQCNAVIIYYNVFVMPLSFFSLWNSNHSEFQLVLLVFLKG